MSSTYGGQLHEIQTAHARPSSKRRLVIVFQVPLSERCVDQHSKVFLNLASQLDHLVQDDSDLL